MNEECIYCEDKNVSTHFLCESCGVGMCAECYDLDIEHTSHYHMILDNYDDRDRKLIIKTCENEPDYICQVCVDKILKR